ncbi:MAG: OmpA family protein [Neisseriaceae bacterium]|nr:OmpA family protein [Neisseriaceae bacterium]
MSKQLKLSTLCVAMTLSCGAFAADNGWVSDASTKDVTLNSYGECWKTAYPDANPEENLRGDCKPAPVVVAPTVPVEERFAKFTLGADGLFDFNKATLRPKTSQELTDMADKVKEYGKQVNISKIVVIGRTDSIGSEAYNLKLSMARAESVKNYLVQMGVNPALIYAQGLGESEATMTAECIQGKKIKTKAQIAQRNACLQPDRNVTITVDGTRMIEAPVK